MEKAMQKYLDKAEVLIEALPYIQMCIRDRVETEVKKKIGI